MQFKSQELLGQLNDWFTRLSVSFDGAKALKYQDGNVTVEYFLRDVLNIAFGWELENANALENKDQDTYDLFDRHAKIVAQVTTTTTPHKIRKTLKSFVKKYRNDFTRLIFVYPTMNAGTCKADFRDLADGFDFVAQRDRFDLARLLKTASSMSPAKQAELLEVTVSHLEPLGRQLPAIGDSSSGRGKRFSTAPRVIPQGGLIGRDEHLNLLLHNINAGEIQTIPQIVKGGGGVGKTMVALEAASRLYESRLIDIVVFIECDSKKAIDNRLSELASKRYLELAESSNPSLETRLDAVIGWFSAPRNSGKWLIIFDGVDTKETKEYIIELLNSLEKGSAIVTSRLDSWGTSVRRINVSVFSQNESTEFLMSRLSPYFDLTDDDNQTLHSIATNLGHLPLGLELAAAHMIYRENLHPKLYLSQWNDEFERLVDYSPETVDYPVGLYLVWRQSIEQLQPSAKSLFESLSCLAAEAFSESQIVTSTTELVASDLEELASLSLISRDSKYRRIVIHKILNEVTFLRLCREGRYQFSLQVASAMIGIALPDPSYDEDGWASWSVLYVHCLTLIERCRQAGMLRSVDRIMQYLGNYLSNRAEYDDAESLLRESLELYVEAPNKYVAGIGGIRMANYANILVTLGKFDEAKQLYEKAIELDVKEFGYGHANTTPKLNSLGQLCSRMGDHEEANRLLNRAVSLAAPGQGDEAIYLNNLALILLDRNDFDGARRAAERAHVIDAYRLGDSHPRIATRLNTLGSIDFAAGDLDKAEARWVEARSILEQTIGADHPNYAKTSINLGRLLQKKGMLNEAEQLMEVSVRTLASKVGRDNPTTQSAINNFVLLLIELGNSRGDAMGRVSKMF